MQLALNSYFVFVLATVVGFYLLDVAGRLLNLRALEPELPAEFVDVYAAEDYARSQAYTRERTRLSIFEDSVSLLVFLAFWWLAGFGWLDAIVREQIDQPLLRGVCFAALLYAGAQILSLPFELYSTFVIEEKYGFNKTTLKTFAADRAKVLLLSALIGAPLFTIVLFFFEHFAASAWLYAWLAVTGLTLLLTYAAPQVILPMFNTFTPLADGELKDAIERMAQQCDFPLAEVFEIDGSRRSTKANAFFTGFGKNKRIALYDTLIKNHTVGELVAILAHEIGHFKKKHITQSLVLGILRMGLLFFLVNLFLNNRGLFDAFGVRETSVYASLILFTFLFAPLSQLMSAGLMILSRKNEYEADRYAAEVTGQPEELVSGLKKLSKENLANLTPHAFFVFMNHSHPPTLKRIEALRATKS